MTLDRAEPDWGWVKGRLGTAEELDRSARECGALLRRREIKDGETLLRLCLGYGCGLSLREASAWAGINGIAVISDVAVMKRLQGAAAWLGHLAGHLVAARLPAASGARAVRIVDATMVKAPGGGLWRLHAAYDLSERRFTHIELTDHRGAEKLERAPVAPGEIRIGDRCYARPEGLRGLNAQGGDFVVRAGWKSLLLRKDDDTPLDLEALLKEARPDSLIDMPVKILNGRKRRLPAVPARLIIIRKADKTAAQSRKRALRSSQQCRARIEPKTLLAADYLILVTSLDPPHWAAEQVVALYRLRWQVELAFKRLKSLLDFDRLPAKNPNLARTWLMAKLLMALILEDLDQDLLDSPPCAPDAPPKPLDMAAR